MSKVFPAEIESACHVFPTEIQTNVTGKVRWFFWWATFSDLSPAVSTVDWEVFKSRIMNCKNTIRKLSLIAKSNYCILKNIG